jgi:hypothetical protein
VTKLRLGEIYTGVPGVYSDVRRDGMASLSPVAQGVVALVGEAEGGGAGAGVPAAAQEYSSPQAVRSAFRSGDLLEGGLIAFDPSDDEEVGGAVKVVTVKVNPATRAAVTLANADGPALLVQSVDYGQFCNRINLQEAHTGVLPAATAEFATALADATETFTDLGGTAWLSCAYSNDGGKGYDVAVASVLLDGSGNPAGFVVDAAKSAMASGATTASWTAGDRITVAANDAANAGKIVTAYGIDSDGYPASFTFTLGALGVYAATATDKRWNRLTGVVISAATAVANIVLADEHATTALTLAFATSDVSKGLISESLATPNLANLVVANRPVALVASGATTDPVVLRGLGIAGEVQYEVITLAGAAAVTGAKSWSKITQIELGSVNPARTVTLGPTTARVRAFDARDTATTGSAVLPGLSCSQSANFTSGDRAIIIAADPADASVSVRLKGLDPTGAYQTETLVTDAAAPDTVPVVGTKVWSKIYSIEKTVYTVDLINVSDEHGNVVQDVDPACFIVPSAGSLNVGIHYTNIPVAGATVSIVANGATVRSVFLMGLDVDGAQQTEEIALTGAVAVVSTKSWTRIDTIYTGDVEQARTLTLTATYHIGGGLTTVGNVVDALNARDGFTGGALTTAPETDLIAELDIPTVATYGVAQPLNVLNLTKSFYAKLTELIRAVNDGSRLVTVSRPAAATGVPSDTAAPVYLTGGSEGVTTNAHWQAAFNTLRSWEEPSCIVSLSDSPTVHAMLKAHLQDRARTLRREADGKVGFPVGTTKAQVNSLTQALNTRHLEGCAQEVQRLDSNGEPTWFPPYMTAALLAGMFAGAPDGTPMTHKIAKVLDVRQDSSWNPTDDAETMLDYGLAFLQSKINVGWRWLRSITTHRADKNLANIEASTNRAVNTFIRGFREILEVKIGAANFAGTQNAVKQLCFAGLDQAIRDGLIVEYQRGVTFVVTGDQIAVGLSVAPVVPLNFVPITCNLYTVTTTI